MQKTSEIDWNAPSGLFEVKCPKFDGTYIWVGECYVCFSYCGETDEVLHCSYPSLSLKKHSMSIGDVKDYNEGPELPEVDLKYVQKEGEANGKG